MHVLLYFTFRYHAAVLGAECYSTPPIKHFVPPMPSRDFNSCYVSHFTENWSRELGPVYSDLGPSVDRLLETDPSFVYVCQRGYNHISGRIYTQ